MPKVQGVIFAHFADPKDYDYTQEMADRFEDLNNIPVRIFTSEDLDYTKLTYPHFGRYKVWELVDAGVEQIIYMDTDMVPLRPLPELPIEDFAAAPDNAQISKEVMEKWRPAFQHAKHYYQSGFFIAKRKTNKVFQRMLLLQTTGNDARLPWLRDQTMLNIEIQIAAKAGDLSVKSLSKQWNHVAMTDSEYVDDVYMMHVTGVHPEVKMRFVHYILNAFCPKG